MLELDRLTPEEKADIARDFVARPIRYFCPRPGQMGYMEATAHIAISIGGNRSGKTLCTCAKNTVHVTGIQSIHFASGMKLPPPPIDVTHWCTDLTRSFEAVIVKHYWELVPPEMLDESAGKRGFNKQRQTLYVKAFGADGRRCVSSIQGMSYEMPKVKGESRKSHIVSLDEIPEYSLFKSQLFRILDCGGYLTGGMSQLAGEGVYNYDTSWVTRKLMRSKMLDIRIFELSTEENLNEMMDEMGEEEAEGVQAVRDVIKDQLDPHEYASRMLGKGAIGRGLIYPEFDANAHMWSEGTVQNLLWLANNGYGEIWCGLDYGIDHPTAVVWTYWAIKAVPGLKIAEGDCIQFAELQVRGRPVSEVCDMILSTPGSSIVLGYMSDPSIWHRESDDQDVAEKFAEGGVGLSKANNSKSLRWDTMHDLLRVPSPGGLRTWPKYRIAGISCPDTAEQFGIYRFASESEIRPRGVDQDVKKEDDLMAALGYVCVFMAGSATLEKREKRRQAREFMTGIPAHLFAAPMPSHVPGILAHFMRA